MSRSKATESPKKKQRVPFGTVRGNKPVISRKKDPVASKKYLSEGKENVEGSSNKTDNKISNYFECSIKKTKNSRKINYTDIPQARNGHHRLKTKRKCLSPIDEDDEVQRHTTSVGNIQSSRSSKDLKYHTQKLKSNKIDKHENDATKDTTKERKRQVSKIQSQSSYSISIRNVEKESSYSTQCNTTKYSSSLTQKSELPKDSINYKTLELSNNNNDNNHLNRSIKSITVKKKTHKGSTVSTVTNPPSKTLNPKQTDGTLIRVSKMDKVAKKNGINIDKTPKLENLSKYRKNKCTITDQDMDIIISNVRKSPIDQHNIRNEEVINTMLSMPHLVGTSTLLGTIVELKQNRNDDDTASEITFYDYWKNNNKKTENHNTTISEIKSLPVKEKVKVTTTRSKKNDSVQISKGREKEKSCGRDESKKIKNEPNMCNKGIDKESPKLYRGSSDSDDSIIIEEPKYQGKKIKMKYKGSSPSHPSQKSITCQKLRDEGIDKELPTPNRSFSDPADVIEMEEPKMLLQGRVKKKSKESNPSPNYSFAEKLSFSNVTKTTPDNNTKAPKESQRAKKTEKKVFESNASPSSIMDIDQELPNRRKINLVNNATTKNKKRNEKDDLSFISNKRYKVCSLQKLNSIFADNTNTIKKKKSQPRVKRSVAVRPRKKKVVLCKKY